MRRAPEPRGTLKPLWNVIPDGYITDYTPTTISIDTHNRANTRIRKRDLAIATETYQKPTQPQENKPRLIHFVACKTVREYNRNKDKIRKFCLEEKKQLQREAQLTGTQQVIEQNRPGTPARASEAREERPNQDKPGTSYMKSNQPLQHQAGPSNKKLNRNSQKLRTERKRKALSPFKKTTRPTRNKTSALEQKAEEAAMAQTKLTLARKRIQQRAQKQHPLIHMDLSALSNSKTIEIKNLASDSSTPSPMRIVTSSSANDFMTKSPKRNIDNVVDRIKASNQAREEQTTKDTYTDTDYANILTIKKADPPKVSTQDNTTTQRNLTTPQPQHSSTPIQQEYHQHHQTAEHDSTSDIENEPQTNTTATDNRQQIHDHDINTIPATKTSEQSPISSLNTEDMEELNKIMFD